MQLLKHVANAMQRAEGFVLERALVHIALSQLMQDKFGETALIAASGEGHIKCATVLLNHTADINYQRKVRLLYVE